MHFESNQIYHIYNRGNDKQKIFFTEANYFFFLQKIKVEWKKYGDVLCYCLMPNHFHCMLVPNEGGCRKIVLADKETHMQNLSKVIGKTLSSYTKAINIQNKKSGNLFQKKTKAKCLTEVEAISGPYNSHDYLLTCFHYIHQNPLKANLVNNLNDWLYSSYPDYYNKRNGTICNRELACKLLEFTEFDFTQTDIALLNDEIIDGLF